MLPTLSVSGGARALEVADTFVRIEDKFIIPRVYEAEVLALLEAHLTATYVDESTRFTLVESLYLDSENLDFLRDHMSGARERYKIRVRRYAPNGVFTAGVAFLESKCKANGVCTKERLELDPASVDALVAGEPLTFTPALRAKNPRVKEHKLAARVERIRAIMGAHGASPRVSVVYHRRAFEGVVDGQTVRVTVDADIRSELRAEVDPDVAASIRSDAAFEQLASYGAKFDPARALVVEVKHASGRPAWLDEFMRDVGAAETSFSKYCWSMLHALTAAPALDVAS